MFVVNFTERWHEIFCGGHIGLLQVSNVENTGRFAALDEQKRLTEANIVEKYGSLSRAELQKLEILQAYRAYYRKFDKTYHVQLQLESIAHKGKKLPNVSPLVDANFAAEMDTLVLTAGHDADLLQPPLTIDASLGQEEFTGMNGALRILKPNDMMMVDSSGVVCTIIYGQDKRTPISPKTKNALYVSYAPSGVPESSVRDQLGAIEKNIRLFAPDAVVKLCEVWAAGDPSARNPRPDTLDPNTLPL